MKKMKNKITLLSLLVVSIMSCTNKESCWDSINTIETISGTRSAVNGENNSLISDKEVLLQCGYDTIGIVQHGDFYIVESKYLISQKLIENFRNAPNSRAVTSDFKLKPHFQKMRFNIVAKCHLPRAGHWTVEYIDELNFNEYTQYYTGYIYIPENGIREVTSTSVSDLPMREFRDADIKGRETIRWGEVYPFENIIREE